MTFWKTPADRTSEPLIFEKGAPGRHCLNVPMDDIHADQINLDLPDNLRRQQPLALPEVTELEVVRHYTRLSQLNASIDTQMYPLGSCTMKYNPRCGEKMARLHAFAAAHPLEPAALHQGALQVMHELGDILLKLTGLAACTLQPAAGAQGELCGIKMIRAALLKRQDKRTTVLVPDSAHGTNPATCSLNGFKVKVLKTGAKGFLSAETVRQAIGQNTAAIMLTNPNTLGIFEQEIEAITKIVHQHGGYVYMDGANMNALLGIANPAAMGVDVMHLNLHKTFSTPHGGGGPGSGPVLCTQELEPFLPTPVLVGAGKTLHFENERPDSIGRLHGFHGNFGMHLRAHSYVYEHGALGLNNIGKHAIVAANYIRSRLTPAYHLAYQTPHLHEVVLTDKKQKAQGVTTLHIAKRLMDFGFHPPTMYFPLIAPGALMIEPTETEPLETLDSFIDAMLKIADEAATNPEIVQTAPHTTLAQRFDEAAAARQPVLHFRAIPAA